MSPFFGLSFLPLGQLKECWDWMRILEGGHCRKIEKEAEMVDKAFREGCSQRQSLLSPRFAIPMMTYKRYQTTRSLLQSLETSPDQSTVGKEERRNIFMTSE
jgi:hypothetical protein